MRAVIVTQEEPFYIPIFMGKVLSESKGVVAVILLPGIPKGFSHISYIKRLYEVFGLKDFLAYGALFTYYRFLDLVDRWLQAKRSYSIHSVARRNSIPIYKLKSINSLKALDLLKSLSPEVLISVASPQIFKKQLISVAKHTINVHAALLPQYRGMMPSFWVLAHGEETTGVTVHYMNEYIDTGDFVLQKTIDISPQDTLHSLQIKVANVGAIALLEALEKIKKSDSPKITPQEKGSYYSFPTKEAAKKFKSRGRRFI